MDEMCFYSCYILTMIHFINFERQLESVQVTEEIEACNTMSRTIEFWHHGLQGNLALWELMVSVMASQA